MVGDDQDLPVDSVLDPVTDTGQSVVAAVSVELDLGLGLEVLG